LPAINTYEIWNEQQGNDSGRQLPRSPASISNLMSVNAAHLAYSIPGVVTDP